MQLIDFLNMIPKELIFIIVQSIGIFVLVSFRKQAELRKNEQHGFSKMQEETEIMVDESSTEPGRRSDTSTGSEEVCTLSDYPEEDVSAEQSRSCIRISGGYSQVKAARRALARRGFLKKSNDGRFPLNGHWETMHGMSVIVEGKLVRWSPKRASRLVFNSVRRDRCSLSLYGETAIGSLVTSITPGGHKIMRWSNGDEWYSTGGCSVAGTAILCHSMTKVQRDAVQDEASRAQAAANLRLVARSGLPLPLECLEHVVEFTGSSTYYVDVHFDTKEPAHAEEVREIVDLLTQHSRVPPHVEIRPQGQAR